MARSKKTNLVKKYFGEFAEQEGFSYVGADSYAWKYVRQKGKVTQEIYICKERFFPNLITLCLFTGMPGWGMQEPKDFLEKYKSKQYWRFETEEEFIEIIQEFVKIMKEHGLDMLEKMSEPKDAIYATPEMNRYLYESYETIIVEADRKYDFEKSGEEGIASITNLLYENKDCEFEEVKEFLIEMAALYLKIYTNDMGGKLILYKGHCVLAETGKSKKNKLFALMHIVDEWKYYHENNVEVSDFLPVQYRQMKNMYI